MFQVRYLSNQTCDWYIDLGTFENVPCVTNFANAQMWKASRKVSWL